MSKPDELLTPNEFFWQQIPTVETSTRFVFDQSIRARGYTIYAREVHKPTGKILEPIWLHLASGKKFTHSEVLQREKITAQFGKKGRAA